MISRVKLNPLIKGKVYCVNRGAECVVEITAHSAREALEMVRMEFGHQYADNACLKIQNENSNTQARL